MSQNDFTIANQGFPAFRADLNSALQALATNNSGTSAPSTTFANMWWYDSTNNIMYIRNEDNDAWIKFAELDQTNDKFVLSGTLQLDDGSASAPALTFNSDTNMGIYRGGTDILRFVTAGADRLQISADGSISTPTLGTSNFRAGVNAGDAIASGGNYNVVVGDEAGTALTTGDANVAVGFEALKTEDGHGNNVAVGYIALKNLNAGANGNNVAVGFSAGGQLTTGVQNTIVGASAGDALTDADFNVAIGMEALSTDTLGSRSTAVGKGTLKNQNFTSATDAYNVAIGYEAGNDITTGTLNTFIGAFSGDALTTGTTNCALGYLTLSAETTGQRNTAMGYSALANQNFTGDTQAYNTAYGFFAGLNITTGIQNTLIGGLAGDVLTDADYNVAIGLSALGGDTKGSKSVAIGVNSLAVQNFTSSTDSHNVAVGYKAGNAVTTGRYNTFIGSNAGDATDDGSENIAIGNDCLGANAGDGNTAMGSNALLNCTGSQNTAIGQIAGYHITSGTKNTIIGRYNGNQGSLDIRTSSNNIVLSDGDGNPRFFIKSTGLPYSPASYSTTTGTAPNMYIQSDGAFYRSTSSLKYKNTINDATHGLTELLTLRPVTYKGNNDGDTVFGGLIAEEVHDAGLTEFVQYNDDGEPDALAYGHMVSLCIKAIQELSAKNDALETRIKTLEG